jgi:hypothetical protein
MTQTLKQALQELIDRAWADFNEIAQEEEQDGFSDAMLSMERTEAMGYAQGLEVAFNLFFSEPPAVNVPPYEQGEDNGNV